MQSMPADLRTRAFTDYVGYVRIEKLSSQRDNPLAL